MTMEKLVRNMKELSQVYQEYGWRGVSEHVQGFWKRQYLRTVFSYFGADRPLKFPRKLQIEATSKCNLRCPSCSHSRENGFGQHLSPDEFKIILDCLPFYPRSIILSGLGEPLVNPHLMELVDILRDRGISCTVFTNGTLLTAQAQKALLSRHNVTSVAVSCDGARKETFESLRCGADFNRWRDFVGNFVLEARRRKPQPVLTSTHTVLSKSNIGEVADIVRLGADMGFRRMHFLDPIPIDGVTQGMLPSDVDLAAMDPRRLSRLGRQLGVHLTFDLRRKGALPRKDLRCLRPWDFMWIRAGGDVCPCPALFGSDKPTVMGNLFQTEFQSIWHGEAFRQFRRSKLEGTNSWCSVCPYN